MNEKDIADQAADHVKPATSETPPAEPPKDPELYDEIKAHLGHVKSVVDEALADDGMIGPSEAWNITCQLVKCTNEVLEDVNRFVPSEREAHVVRVAERFFEDFIAPAPFPSISGALGDWYKRSLRTAFVEGARAAFRLFS